MPAKRLRKSGQPFPPPLLHTNGYAMLHEVPRTPLTRTTPKTTTLVPNLLSVGAYNRFLGTQPVTFAQTTQQWTPAQTNDVLLLLQALKGRNLFPPKQTCEVPPTNAESTPLLSAWCESSRTPTMPVLAAAA